MSRDPCVPRGAARALSESGLLRRRRPRRRRPCRPASGDASHSFAGAPSQRRALAPFSFFSLSSLFPSPSLQRKSLSRPLARETRRERKSISRGFENVCFTRGSRTRENVRALRRARCVSRDPPRVVSSARRRAALSPRAGRCAGVRLGRCVSFSRSATWNRRAVPPPPPPPPP